MGPRLENITCDPTSNVVQSWRQSFVFRSNRKGNNARCPRNEETTKGRLPGAKMGAGKRGCPLVVMPTGKLKRVTFYGKTRQEVADKLAKALHDKQQGTVVAPHKLTLSDWLRPGSSNINVRSIRAITYDTYETIGQTPFESCTRAHCARDLRPDIYSGITMSQSQQGLETRTIRTTRASLNALSPG